MKRKAWYCIALFLPIIVPAISLVIDVRINGMLPHHSPPTSIFGILNAVLLAGLTLGGLQYIIFAGGVLWWSRNKTAEEITRIIWLLPLLFAPVFTFGFILENILLGGFSGGIASMALFTLISFPNSYLYVFLTYGLTSLLQKAGWVRD